MSRIVSGSFAGTGASTALKVNTHGHQKMATLSISGGSMNGTVILQRSYDAGVTWHNVESYTVITEKNFETPSDAFIYRLECTVFVAGPIAYAIAQ